MRFVSFVLLSNYKLLDALDPVVVLGSNYYVIEFFRVFTPEALCRVILT